MYAKVKEDVMLASISGGTDICSCFALGNPMLPAIHGGVLGAFMEMTALAQLSAAAPMKRQPRTIDVSIEYLRSGRPLTTYARASIKKLGRRIANVHVEAWQETRSAPIATMRGLFLVAPSDD